METSETEYEQNGERETAANNFIVRFWNFAKNKNFDSLASWPQRPGMTSPLKKLLADGCKTFSGRPEDWTVSGPCHLYRILYFRNFQIRIWYGYSKYLSDMDQELKNQYPLTSGRLLLLPKLKSECGVKRNFWPLRNFWPVVIFQLFCFSEQRNKVWRLAMMESRDLVSVWRRRDPFFELSVSKVSGLVSVSKDFGLGLELLVSRLCIGYFLWTFARRSSLKNGFK